MEGISGWIGLVVSCFIVLYWLELGVKVKDVD